MSDFHRTNINIYRKDFEFLLAHYGWGWTNAAREAIHRHVEELKAKRKPEHSETAFAGYNPPTIAFDEAISLDKLIQEQDQ